MKYLLLIHQGDSPTPRDPEARGALPEQEHQAVCADYQAINATPGVTPGVGAVAVAETDGPAVALGIVDRLDLDEYRYWHSTRAELLRRLGRTDDAVAAFERARALTYDEAERRLLDRRLTELRSGGGHQGGL